jgi:hypothetical protein
MHRATFSANKPIPIFLIFSSPSNSGWSFIILEVIFASRPGIEALYDFPVRDWHPQVALTIGPHVWGYDEIPAHDHKGASVVQFHGLRRDRRLRCT